MNTFVDHELERRFAAYQEPNNVRAVDDNKSRTVMDLALDKYLEEQPRFQAKCDMDSTSKEFAISQIKLFILAGHDTTGSTLCYIFYLL